ncbi:MAG TPA: hypothetical protein VKZ41_01740 [Gemmatimonadales bacterium]|nr:hypothetical protein [Gemmatimonadales bacterium]
MKILLSSAWLLFAASLSCAAQATTFEIGNLGKDWSGREAPDCEEREGDMVLPESESISWECEWLIRSIGGSDERIHDLRGESHDVRAVFWQRPLVGDVSVSGVVDSLKRVLIAKGFEQRECKMHSDSTVRYRRLLWERQPQAIQLMVRELPDGSRVLLYTAVEQQRFLLDHNPCLPAE